MRGNERIGGSVRNTAISERVVAGHWPRKMAQHSLTVFSIAITIVQIDSPHNTHQITEDRRFLEADIMNLRRVEVTRHRLTTRTEPHPRARVRALPPIRLFPLT